MASLNEIENVNLYFFLQWKHRSQLRSMLYETGLSVFKYSSIGSVWIVSINAKLMDADHHQRKSISNEAWKRTISLLRMLTFLKLKNEKQDPILSRLTVFGRVLEDVNTICYFDVHSTDSTKFQNKRCMHVARLRPSKKQFGYRPLQIWNFLLHRLTWGR